MTRVVESTDTEEAKEAWSTLHLDDVSLLDGDGKFEEYNKDSGVSVSSKQRPKDLTSEGWHRAELRTAADKVAEDLRADDSRKPRAVASMPLATDRDALGVLVKCCGISTRIALAKVCVELKQSVVALIRRDSGPPMAKLGAALSGALPVVECDSSEVPCVVAAASGQLIVCVSNCVLLFLQRGGRWLVAVHCDDREVAVVGWKQPAEECSQRPIRNPITEKPTVAVSMLWETSVRGVVIDITESGDSIAVGTHKCVALLNAHTCADSSRFWTNRESSE